MKKFFQTNDADDAPGAPPVTPAPTQGNGWSALTSTKKIGLMGVGVGAVLAVCMWPDTPKPVPVAQQDTTRENAGHVQEVQEDSTPEVQPVTNRVLGTTPTAPRHRRPVASEMALYSAAIPEPIKAAPVVTPAPPPAGEDQGGALPPLGTSGGSSALDRELGGATHLPRSSATLVSNPSFVIRPGAAIPCLRVEAVNSSLPGFATCRLKDWYRSSDLTRGLLPPGTVIFGQEKNGLSQGVQRLGILYTLIETPWFNQAINAPAADAMGRPGVDGDVKTFFWDKLGAVAAYSLLDVAVGAGQNVASSAMSKAFNGGSGTTLNLGAQGQSLGNAEFGATINRPNILTADEGLPITVMIGQELDFTAACTRAMHTNPMACPLQ